MRRTKEEALKTRETVLKAAAQIILRLGGSAFTLEAVAQQAGITKGGVLHHFPSKEALIDGLIDQAIEAFNGRLTAELAAEPEERPGRWLRAYIRTVFLFPYEGGSLIPALAAAVSAEHTLERIREGFRMSQQMAIHDGLDPILAIIIRTAVDGVVFARALSLDVLDKDVSQTMYEELLRLTEQARSTP